MLSVLLIIVVITSTFTTPRLNAKTNNYKYAKTTVNVRKKPNKKSKIVGKLYWNDKVKPIKKVNKKWWKVKYRKKIRYIYSSYLRKKPYKYKSYSSPSSKTFKSFEDADCITNSTKSAHGRLKREYHLDYHSGVWMVGNRYCIAVGSFYAGEKVGVKIDLVLSHNGRKHTLKCITADSKSDKDTIKNHRVHKDGSVTEFIVKTSALPRKALLMGDISYAGKQFIGKIVKIKVYK